MPIKSNIETSVLLLFPCCCLLKGKKWRHSHFAHYVLCCTPWSAAALQQYEYSRLRMGCALQLCNCNCKERCNSGYITHQTVYSTGNAHSVRSVHSMDSVHIVRRIMYGVWCTQFIVYVWGSLGRQ